MQKEYERHVVSCIIFFVFTSTKSCFWLYCKFSEDYGTQFAGGEKVRVLVKVTGELTERNPADRAKEIRHY